jgi:DNA-binding GntR family transcriptional regulator
LSKARQGSLDEVRCDHEALLDALGAHDSGAATAATHQHVSKFREQVRAAL